MCELHITGYMGGEPCLALLLLKENNLMLLCSNLCVAEVYMKRRTAREPTVCDV